MKWFCYVVWFYILLSVAAKAAQPPVDSLKAVLDVSKSIEVKIDVYNALCRYYWYQSLDSSAYYCDQALTLAKLHKYLQGEAVAQYEKGVIERIRGNYLKAAEFYVESLRLCKENGLDYYVAANYNALGVLYKITGEWNEALSYFYHALDVSSQDDRSKGSIFNNIGEIYLKQERYDSALHYCQLSAQIREDSPNLSNKIKTYINLGEIYRKLSQIDSSKYYFTNSVNLAVQISDELNHAKAYLGLAKIEMESGKFMRAIEYTQVAKSITTKIGAQQEYLQSLKMLTECYRELGKYKIALDYFQEYADLKALLINDEKAREINLLQLRNSEILNESLQNKMDLQAAALQAERNRSIMMVIGVSVLLVLAILFFILFRIKRSVSRKLSANNAEITAQNLKLNKLNDNIDARNRAIRIQNTALTRANDLKSKLISILSHDLRSPINSLSALLPLFEASAVSQEEFQKMMPELRHRVDVTQNFLNTLLYWAKTQIQEDSIEIEQVDVKSLIDETLSLMEPQFERKKLKVINEVPDEVILQTDRTILLVVLKNLISNAIKFSNEGGEIKIYYSKGIENKLCIQDHGVGMTEETAAGIFEFNFSNSKVGTKGETGTGIGLSFAKELMHKIKGDIEVASEYNKGSTFCLSFSSQN